MNENWTDVIIFSVVVLTSLGLTFQCVQSHKAGRAEYLSFPIATLIQFPYPMWATLSWLNDDWRLLSISLIMGIPNAWLSIQYFLYEYKASVMRTIDGVMTLLLSMIGIVLLVVTAWQSGLTSALAATAAYFTCCISIFSYLVKIWRVSRGQESLEGLKWATLITLLIFYVAMIYVGKASAVPMLSLSYVFSVSAIVLAILYKAFIHKSAAELKA